MVIFMDSFELYGTDEDLMVDGPYLNVSIVSLSTTVARTGTKSLGHGGGADGLSSCRRGLKKNLFTIGCGFAVYINQMPSANNKQRLIDFRDEGDKVAASIMITTAGNITLWRGKGGESGTQLAITEGQPLVTGAWQYFECLIHLDDTEGYCELRVDEVTVMNVDELDTIAGAFDEVNGCAQVGLIGTYAAASGSGGPFYIDDLVVWDTTGTENNDFIGDRKVLRLQPDGNGATQEWSPVGQSSQVNCIDDDVANDDTDYIEAASTSLPRRSEFTFADLPSGVGGVSAIQTTIRAKKTDSGGCNVKVSVRHDSDEAAGAERPMTTAYTFWQDVHELDPKTGALFTPAGLDDTLLVIDRVSTA